MKRDTHIYLSDEAWNALEKLKAETDLSGTKVIEWLLRASQSATANGRKIEMSVRIVSVVKRSQFLELLCQLYEQVRHEDRYGRR